MEQDSLHRLLALARAGDEAARAALLEEHRGFVEQVARQSAGRAVDWHDDELSIALVALNEAIDTFDPSRGSSFTAYAGRVIRNRLTDFFRKEGRLRRLEAWSAAEAAGDEGGELASYEVAAAWRRHEEATLQAERAEELAELERRLRAFGIGLDDLVAASPAHRDTRATLMRVATCLAARPDLLEEFYARRRLPVAALARAAGVSRKVVQRGRHYITALVLLLTGAEFDHLRSYFRLAQGGPERNRTP